MASFFLLFLPSLFPSLPPNAMRRTDKTASSHVRWPWQAAYGENCPKRPPHLWSSLEMEAEEEEEGGAGPRNGSARFYSAPPSVRPEAAKISRRPKSALRKAITFWGRKVILEGRGAARFPFPPRLNPISCLSRTTRRRKMAKRTDERANATHTNCPIRMNVCRSLGRAAEF